VLRFSIKDLLWLTALLGISIGWYLNHRTAAGRQEADREALSSIDTGLQRGAHLLKELQKELDELQSKSVTSGGTKTNW
jgi:hypothetical protein